MEWRIRLAAAIATTPFRDDYSRTKGSFVSGAHGPVVNFANASFASDLIAVMQNAPEGGFDAASSG